ncbi:MAG: galactokinase [Planctomycetota bacterium]
MDTAPTLADLVKQAEELFAQQFGHAAQYTVAAPGRVNLIGEHTDYNDGFVLPMAIERYVVIAAARPQGEAAADRFVAYSDMFGEKQAFAVTGGGPTDLPQWCVYPHGVLDLLHERGVQVGPLELAVVSTVPQGGGLSSSAAFEVATATLAEAVSGQPLDGRDKAKLCQQAENDYAGVPCGIMDQFASALCAKDEAMRLDCRSLEITPVPLTDPAVTVLITNSNVKHDLGSSEYPVRRASCESAAEKLGVKALRDVTLDELIAGRDKLTEVEFRRARHVVTANERTASFHTAATAGDWATAGKLMFQSHASLRDDYEVSCPQVDLLVAIAENIGREGGVYGSRITGGGFGGCTVTLAATDHAQAIAERLLADYKQETGIEATAFTTRPAQGAHVVRR